LNRLASKDPNFLDDGRRESPAATTTLQVRVLTLRQLKTPRLFFHNGSFKEREGLVQYFNAGVPQNAQSGTAVR